MNYDAIAITAHDLQLGTSFIKQLEKDAAFPFLSANIVSSKSKKPIFTPYITLKKNNINIGIIGLTSPHETATGPNYEVTDWQQPLENALTQLTNVDLTIILSNLSAKKNLEIAKKYNEINIIFEAGQELTGPTIQLKHNTLITHTQKEGKYIGELQIDWLKSKTWQQKHQPILELKNEIDRLQWFQNRIEKRGGPEKAYAKNRQAQEGYNNKMRKLQELQLKLSKINTQPSTSEVSSSYTSQLHPLTPSIHDEPQTTKILKTSRKQTNNLRRKTDILKRFDVYAGSLSCKKCHEPIYLQYEKTRHNKAYQTLVTNSDNNNPNCVYCHVTGLPERLAHVGAAIPTRLLNVGCETCHGPGQQHIKKPKTYKLKKEVPETTCLTCHTDDHSDDFNYNRDMNFVH